MGCSFLYVGFLVIFIFVCTFFVVKCLWGMGHDVFFYIFPSTIAKTVLGYWVGIFRSLLGSVNYMGTFSMIVV